MPARARVVSLSGGITWVVDRAAERSRIALASHDGWWAVGGQRLNKLTHLYLNHNQLVGEIPERFVEIGGSRLAQLQVSYNRFTGVFPAGWRMGYLEALEMQHNNFTAFGSGFCKLSVFAGGRAEMTTLRSDCNICNCYKI